MRDAREGERFTVNARDDLEGMIESREHAEAEEIELHEPRIGAVVFVPLHDGSALHACAFDRDDIDHGTIAQHHSARVNAEVARGIAQLGREVFHIAWNVRIAQRREGTFDCFRVRILLPHAVAERTRSVAYREPRLVGDDVRDLRGVLAPVPLENILKDFLSPIGGNVDVDVRRAVPLGRKETLEEKSVKNGIDRRDAEAVAHGGVGGGSSPLAQDSARAAKLDDVVDDEEVPGKAQIGDDTKLVVDLLPCSLNAGIFSRAVALFAEALGEGSKPAFLTVPLGGGGWWKVGCGE